MTGYGKVVVVFKDKKISAEIKSLNSKQLDLQTRIAPLYREKEMEIRQMVAAALERGKVDFSLWIEKDTGIDATPVNAALVENYYHQLKDIAHRVGIAEPQDWLYTLTRMPDVLTKTDQEVLSDEEWVAARQAVEGAIKALVDFRIQEGAALEKKFAEKIDNIERLMAEIEPYEKSRAEKIRQRAGAHLLHRETRHQRGETATGQSPQILPRNHARWSRTGQETGIHRPGDGPRNQHHWFQVQPGRDAKHRRPDERRTGTD